MQNIFLPDEVSGLLPDGTLFSFWEKETVYTKELHVSASAGEDGADGSAEHPFRRIQQAADIAEPGTKVLIHGGVYRECVRPAKGGTDPEHMISYEAAGDGEVLIKASEKVTDFFPSEGWNLAARPGGEVNPDIRIWGP